MDFVIRTLRNSEGRALSRFAEACFREAFGSLIAPEPMNRLCARAFALPLMQGLIQKGTWIAEGTEGWRGYVSLGDVPCPATTLPEPVLELARLYVAPPWQGTGVANALMETFLVEARERGGRSVWLQAHEGNSRALAFYRRWGFRDLGSMDIVVEDLHIPHRALGLELA